MAQSTRATIRGQSYTNDDKITYVAFQSYRYNASLVHLPKKGHTTLRLGAILLWHRRPLRTTIHHEKFSMVAPLQQTGNINDHNCFMIYMLHTGTFDEQQQIHLYIIGPGEPMGTSVEKHNP